ncbi:MAG: hypothetical protein HOP33_20730 [Verrucomicrobia bacterium]|nr:hypothetical protein [Verrucomicrobiota bacterium]
MPRQLRIQYPGAIYHVMNRGDDREARCVTAEEKARRNSNEELDKPGWTDAELAGRAKGDARKNRIAQRLRAETAVTLKRIAAELHMAHGSNLLHHGRENEDENQSEPNLCQK